MNIKLWIIPTLATFWEMRVTNKKKKSVSLEVEGDLQKVIPQTEEKATIMLCFC